MKRCLRHLAHVSAGTSVVSLWMLLGPNVPTSPAFGACPDARFAPQVAVPADGTVEGIAVADFDRDGNLDLVVTNFSSGGGASNSVAILLGDGRGRFGTPTHFAVGRGATRIVVADLNADRNSDVVALNSNDSTVSVLLGDGRGGLFPQTAFTTGGGTVGMAAGDLNGDGRIDLIVTDLFADRITVLFGNGDGSFEEPAPFPAGLAPLFVAVGDLNADGHLDLAVDNTLDATVSILPGRGDGTFAERTTVPLPAGVLAEFLIVSDLNGDGHPDLAVGDVANDTIVVLRGNGDGSFEDPAAFPVGDLPVFFAASDLNGDGHPDLAVANINDSTVSVLLGQGDGTFAPQTVLAVGDGPIPIEIADLNHDGAPDIVTGNFVDQTVSILLNECAVNRPPIARAGPDQVLECAGDSRALARLDGSDSVDPDSIPGAADDIVRFAWSEQGTPLAGGATVSVPLSLGAHAVTLDVTDAAGATDSDVTDITVRDTTPPRISSVVAIPGVLSPPDQRLVPVSIEVVAADACDAAPVCRIDAVTSNASVAGIGRGARRVDAILSDPGPAASPAALGVFLRAERTGAGFNRVYTISVSCRDAAGLATRGQTTVSVASPHAQRF